MPSAPSIPAEIAFKIIDFGEDGFVAFKSTSLVCKIWRDHSQRCLFRALHLTVHPTGDYSIRRLEGIGLASSVRIRSYIRSLYLTFPVPDGNEPDVWLNTHEQLLVQVLKMLDGLSTLVLYNGWPIFDYVVKRETLVPQFPSIARCIEDLCASPTLGKLSLGGRVPILRLVSRCSPALKELETLTLYAPSIPANMEPPNIPISNPQASIALERLTVVNSASPQATNASLLSHLLDPLRSLFDLASLRELEIAGDGRLDGPLRQLFETCSGTLESLLISSFPSASSSKSFRLSLRKASNMKRLSLSCRGNSMFSGLTDFMDWLLQELASDQKQGGECHPSNLESVTLAVTVCSSVLELDVRQAGALSDIFSDSRQYPKIKEVKLVVHVIFPISFWGSTPLEIERKEKLESAMGALKERGILQLQC